MIHIQRILYATDFSSYSNQAYFHAVSLAKAHQATLVVVYVYDPSQNQSPPPPQGVTPADYWREQLEQIRPLDESIPVEHHLLIGDPASELVNFTLQHPINLVVMGTHGRTGLDRLLMGSL
ncbi:MAG: universal stress protein, partial [Gemmataceae bacterium]